MRILYITSTRIGDAVLSSGVLAHLVESYPQARFTLACGPDVAPLFAAVPRLDRVIELRKSRAARYAHWYRLWRQVCFTFWSVIVDMRGSVIPYTVPARRRFVRAADRPDEHKVVQAGRTLGLDPPPDPRIWVSDDDRRRARDLVPEGLPVLALGPTANWGGKQWPPDRFADLVERVTAPGGILPGARVALFAAPHEREAALPVFQAVPEERRVDLAGQTDLLTAYACIERCAFYIGNDSGLMHLAAATGVPTLGLFGPSRESNYAPWGAHTAVVRTEESYEEIVQAPDYDYLSHETRMGSLSVAKVQAAAEALWERCGGGRIKRA